MPEVIYTKSKITDFNNNLDEGQLHQEILDDSEITTTILRIDRTNDVVNIVFNNTLSSPEETELNTLISNHNPDLDKITELTSFIPRNTSYKLTTYEKLATFQYRGSSKEGLIKKVTIIGYKDTSLTNYIIRAYDVTNNIVLGYVTCTNNDNGVNYIDTFSNISTKKSVIEIQGKKTGGNSNDKYYIDSIQVYV